MAFGYSLMKGRAGAAGYIRENGDHREVSARGIPPGTVCKLYRRRDGECLLWGPETSDSSGTAQWTIPKDGSVFIAGADQVLLWEGGDEAFLLANAWLKNQGEKKGRSEKTKKPPEERQAVDTTHLETAENETESGAEHIKQTEVRAASKQNKPQCTQPQDKQTEVCSFSSEYQKPDEAQKQKKESPPERAYTLRPAGKGEPVDTLPERGEA